MNKMKNVNNALKAVYSVVEKCKVIVKVNKNKIIYKKKEKEKLLLITLS
jgi:hypothetical protein